MLERNWWEIDEGTSEMIVGGLIDGLIVSRETGIPFNKGSLDSAIELIEAMKRQEPKMQQALQKFRGTRDLHRFIFMDTRDFSESTYPIGSLSFWPSNIAHYEPSLKTRITIFERTCTNPKRISQRYFDQTIGFLKALGEDHLKNRQMAYEASLRPDYAIG